jgi:hypothetical protein
LILIISAQAIRFLKNTKSDAKIGSLKISNIL